MAPLRVVAWLLLAALLPQPRCEGAVHLYNGVFSPLNDAYVFRAGREGMFRSQRDQARVQHTRLSAAGSRSHHLPGGDGDSERRVEHPLVGGASASSSVEDQLGEAHPPLQVEFIRSNEVASRHEDGEKDELTGTIVTVVFKARRRGGVIRGRSPL